MPDPEENAGANGTGDGAGDGNTDDKKTNMVPQEKFGQVYGQVKNLEREITDLKKGNSEGKLTPEQQKELEAKTYLKNLMKETLSETEKEKSEREKSELDTFKKDVDDVLTTNTDVKKNDFLKFLDDEGDDYSSVAAAMRGYKRQGEVAKDASDKTKADERKKPDMPKSEGDGTSSVDYSEKDKGKNLWQVAQDAIKEFTSKKK